MADINLIGNDQGGSKRGGRSEEEFSDSSEFGQSFDNEVSSDMGYETQDAYMEQGYMKKGPKGIMYILIGACVVLFTLLMILLFSDEEKPATPPEKKETTPKVEQPTTPEAPVVTGPNQEMVRNVTALMEAFPPDMKLAMLRYSQGQFIIESHAKNEAAAEVLTNQIRQKLPRGTIRETNKSKSSGGDYHVCMVSGTIPEGSVWNRPEVLNTLTYITESDLKGRVENICTQTNLKLKTFNIGKSKSENNFQKVMVKIKVNGTKNDATQLIKTLNTSKLNVYIAKVVFTPMPGEKSFAPQTINMLIDLELFKK
jgi:hypothetical protein